MFERMKRRQDFATALLLAGVALMLCGCFEGVKSGMYTCSMHPQVKSETPGRCPICEMALEPMAKPVRTERSSSPAGSHNAHSH